MTALLRRVLPFKDIGWPEHGEEFTRFTLLKTRWGNLYLHRLKCLKMIPFCHDHPWWFLTLILRGGYWEYTTATSWVWRRPGSLLYRPATHRHGVMTPAVMWSLVLTGPKCRDWAMTSCPV